MKKCLQIIIILECMILTGCSNHQKTVQNEVQNDVQHEVENDVQIEVQNELQKKVQNELQNEVQEGTQESESNIKEDESTIQENENSIQASGNNSSEDSLKPWQQAYIDYLNNTSVVGANEGYMMIYIDNDEIPELVEVGTCEASGSRIVNYSNDAVHVTQLGRRHFTYIEKENLLCNSDGSMDHYYDLVYSIVEGQMTRIGEGYYGAEDNQNIQFDDEGNVIYEYEWNGIQMSEEEYEKEVNLVYDFSKEQGGYYYDELYLQDEIVTLIENYYL